MSIKMYINGTPGQKDGTEITSLTFKNMKNYMGGRNNPFTDKPCVSYIPICLREEEGYIASKVTITTRYDNNLHCMVGGPYNSYSDIFSSSQTSNNIGTVSSTNILIYVSILSITSIPAGTTLFNISYIEDPA